MDSVKIKQLELFNNCEQVMLEAAVGAITKMTTLTSEGQSAKKRLATRLKDFKQLTVDQWQKLHDRMVEQLNEDAAENDLSIEEMKVELAAAETMDDFTRIAIDDCWDLEAWCTFTQRIIDPPATDDYIAFWGKLTALWGVDPEVAEEFSS